MRNTKAKQALTAQTYTAQQWADLQAELNAECGLNLQLQKQLQTLQKQYNTLLTRSITLNEDYRDIFKDKFRSVERANASKFV